MFQNGHYYSYLRLLIYLNKTCHAIMVRNENILSRPFATTRKRFSDINVCKNYSLKQIQLYFKVSWVQMQTKYTMKTYNTT